MCGIVGILSHEPVAKRLVEGLKRLEYRGYDSAGVATFESRGIQSIKAAGKIFNLEEKLKGTTLKGNIGIAHTRWATHGKPSVENAHPHGTKDIAVVHNGIIENYQDLRKNLLQKGHQFESETDSEVIAHLILQTKQEHPELNHTQVLLKVRDHLKGAYALVILFHDDPETLYGLRMASPLVVGTNSQQEMFFGSDTIALNGMINSVIYMEDGDLAVLKRGQSEFYDHSGLPAIRRSHKTATMTESVQKGRFAHFMLKEIHEQPDALRRTLQNLISENHDAINLPITDAQLNQISAIRIIACGTSYFAGLVAKYWIETFTQVPVAVEIASEFRYFTPPLQKKTLCVFISQSGETADTLAALKLVKAKKLPTLGVVNVEGSSIAREVDAIMQTKAGPEIGVASTKAFTAQLTTLAAFSIKLALVTASITKESYQKHIQEMLELPTLLEKCLKASETAKRIAGELSTAVSALYIGRGGSHAIALEGALKLKEISYIHAEAYAGGELKHGPIALIDHQTPTIAIVPHDKIFEKMVSNIEEIKARNGKVIAITDTEGAFKLKNICDDYIIVPSTSPLTMPFVMTAPVQLLAYETALAKGTDVDQPRNLAKSVTVE